MATPTAILSTDNGLLGITILTSDNMEKHIRFFQVTLTFSVHCILSCKQVFTNYSLLKLPLGKS